MEDGFLGSAGMSDWRRVTNSFTKHAASPNKDKKPSRGAEIHKWAEGRTILEGIFCSVLVNDQQSLSTSLDDPCFAFCNPDQLSHGKVFTGHGLKNIPIQFKDQNDKMLRKQRCAYDVNRGHGSILSQTRSASGCSKIRSTFISTLFLDALAWSLTIGASSSLAGGSSSGKRMTNGFTERPEAKLAPSYHFPT